MTFPVGRANQSPWQALITLQAILLAEAQLLSDLTGAGDLLLVGGELAVRVWRLESFVSNR